jgi:hypothetical protein
MISALLTFFVFLIVLQLLRGEGISHASHLMLKAAEDGDTEKVIDYVKNVGVPINVKNNFGVR